MESIADCIAVDYQKGPLQKNQKTDNRMVLPFSLSYEHLKRNPRPVDMFVCFFAQEAKLVEDEGGLRRQPCENVHAHLEEVGGCRRIQFILFEIGV